MKIDRKHYEALAEQKCPECGEPMLSHCPSCGAVIKQWQMYGNVLAMPKSMAKNFHLPDICPQCGQSFPWAAKKGKPAATVPG